MGKIAPMAVTRRATALRRVPLGRIGSVHSMAVAKKETYYIKNAGRQVQPCLHTGRCGPASSDRITAEV